MSLLHPARGAGEKGPSGPNGPKRVFKRTQLCMFWVRGACKRGSSCAFAHGEAQLRESPDLSKTKICKKFQTGACPLGEECTFAHCREELRSLRPSKRQQSAVQHAASASACAGASANVLVTSCDTWHLPPEAEMEDSESQVEEWPYTVVDFQSVERVCEDLLEGETPLLGARDLLFEL
ncbi:zfs1 [Symbiodinium microadriaticum]|nr:zfs1 [Symbiodinium microadriaticum]CAE7654594.1 zfs1 [Symbiodinium sp. KB8]